MNSVIFLIKRPFMKKRVLYTALLAFLAPWSLSLADPVTYTFTGKVTSIIYRDNNGEELSNPSAELTAQFEKYFNASCTYIFKVDTLRPGEYIDENGVLHQVDYINETQALPVEDDMFPDDSIISTLSARAFYCQLEEGALFSDLTVEDVSYMNFGMEYEAEISYKIDPEATPIIISSLRGVNIVVGQFSKYIDIRTREETTRMSQWTADLSYVGTEYISLGSVSVALISNLSFPSVEPEPEPPLPPAPVPEAGGYLVMAIFGLVAALGLKRRKPVTNKLT